MTTPCPHCGQQLAIVPVSSGMMKFRALTDRPMTTLENAAATPFDMPAAAVPGEWQKITPVGRLETKDITTALYDSGVSFALITLAAGAVVYAAGWPWLVAPAGGLGVAMWRYFGGLRLARSLLEIVETLTQTDFNRDGQVGKPVEHVVKVEVKNNNQWQFATLPGQPAALIALAKAVISGVSFAERPATDLGLTQEEYGKLRDVFIDRGWAAWNHPTRRQAGVTLTVSGKAVLRSIAAAPLPQDDAGTEL